MKPPMSQANLSTWSFDVPILVPMICVSVLYLVSMRKLRLDRRTREQVTPWRMILFFGGVVAGFLALESPLHTWAEEYLFTAHMIEHEMLTMLTAPLVLLGCPPALLQRVVDWRPIHALVTTLTRPAVAATIFAVIMLFWHIPTFYDAALRSDELHGVQHLLFLAGSILFWWPIIDPLARHGLSRLGQLVYVMIASWPNAVLGFFFVALRQPLYSVYVQAPRVLDLSPTDDQQVGGALMLGIEALILFVALSLLFYEAMRSAGEETAGP